MCDSLDNVVDRNHCHKTTMNSIIPAAAPTNCCDSMFDWPFVIAQINCTFAATERA